MSHEPDRAPETAAEPARPLVEELSPSPDSEAAFRRLAGLPGVVFLDSARRDAKLGRFSYLACSPFLWLERPAGGSGSFERLKQELAPFHTATVPELPPFQGGAAGLFSYELGRELERIAPHRGVEFQLPALAVGLYDLVVAWDHVAGRSWIISHGFPESDPRRRQERAESRLSAMRSAMIGDDLSALHSEPPARGCSHISLAPILESQLPPRCHAGPVSSVTSDFTRDEYRAAIARAIEYVHAGDLFQVNLAQGLLHAAVDDSVSLYQRLRRRNPATFAGYLDLGQFQIVSASPERFLQVRGGQVETRPIKGTRRRQLSPEAEMYTSEELRESAKDAAENVMIVDLLRNDLSKVCRPESVRVTQLCQVETYEYVQHLVSAVTGELKPGVTALDALQAAFPGGSVTGAPKVRAMEIIAELERTQRGAYCGSLAFVGFDGALDASILIRTVTAGRGWWRFPVGGGIVADSHVDREYEETWHKAEGILRSLLP